MRGRDVCIATSSQEFRTLKKVTAGLNGTTSKLRRSDVYGSGESYMSRPMRAAPQSTLANTGLEHNVISFTYVSTFSIVYNSNTIHGTFYQLNTDISLIPLHAFLWLAANKALLNGHRL